MARHIKRGQWVRVGSSCVRSDLENSPNFHDQPNFIQICQQRAVDAHLKHPRASLGQQDPLLDCSSVGAMDSMSAVDLSGQNGCVDSTQPKRESA